MTLSCPLWCCIRGETPSHRARHSETLRGRWEAHLLGLGADSVPHRIQLAPYNVIKALEQAVLQSQLTGVYLVGLAQLLHTGVHQI